MPPPPPPVSSTDQILRSLEEIRDSLANRVEELSLAVDRLRSQAGLLERRAGEVVSSTSSPAAVTTMPPNRTRSSSVPSPAAAQEPPEQSSIPITTSSRPPRDASSPAPNPDRPLSNEEIHLLLDRASQPPVNPAAEIPSARFEDTLERLRTTRRRIREMQTRTSALGNIMDHDIAPRLDPLSADIGDLPWDWTDPLERALAPEAPQPSQPRAPRQRQTARRTGGAPPASARVYDNADDALAAANDYLTSMRDPLRVPTRRELDNMGAGMDAIEPEIIESLVRERFISSPSARGRARSRGCRPTNVGRLRTAPKPEVVRSTPPSPASTITPEMSTAALPIPIPTAPAPAPSTATPSHRRLEAIRANLRQSTRSRRAPTEAHESPMTFGNSSLALPGQSATRTRRRRGDDEALTFRGMDVAARINDPDAPRSSPSGDLEDSMVTEFILSVFSRLRDDEVALAPVPQPIPPNAPRLANARIPTPDPSMDNRQRLIGALLAEQERLETENRRATQRRAERVGLMDSLAGVRETLTGERRNTTAALAAAEARLASARQRLMELEAQANQEEADRRERRGVLGVHDVLRGLGEGDGGNWPGPVGGRQHRERSAALTASGVGNGPRNERPEDVDTVVQIRQFQDGADESRQRGLRDRLRQITETQTRRSHHREIDEVRRAAGDVFQARRVTTPPPPRGGRPGHDLAYWANEAGEEETIFDATRRALATDRQTPLNPGRARSPAPAAAGMVDGVEGVFVTVAVSTDPLPPPFAEDDENMTREVVESMRRQFESLSGGAGDPMPDMGAGTWHMEVIGPNGQILEARGEGEGPSGAGGRRGEGMEESMERLAWAIVQSAEGTGTGGAAGRVGQNDVLEGVGGVSGAGSSRMSREASARSTRAVEDETAKDDHRGSTAVRSDIKDSSLEAESWPEPSQPQATRRARPYISMLDL